MSSEAYAEAGKYQGWRNYETWTVALWLDNERQNYEYWREEARRCQREAPTNQRVADGIWTPEQAATFNLADHLRNEVTAGRPSTGHSMYTDLLYAALSEVDWEEIAESLLNELD